MSDGGDSRARDEPRAVADAVRGHHRHRPRRLRALAYRNGIPYEIERIVCSSCARILAERPLGRAQG